MVSMLFPSVDRYIFKHAVKLSLLYTLLPTLILWLVQSRKIFEFAVGGKVSLGVLLKLSLYVVPTILPHIIPFAAMLGVITLIIRLYNDSELVILWASGLSPARLMRCFLIFGFLNMALILVINIFIAAQASRQLKIELLNLKNDLIRTALKPNLIQTPQKDLMIYIDRLKGQQYIKGFYLQHFSKENHMRIFTAKEAFLDEEGDSLKLLLIDGRIVQWQVPQARKTGVNTQEKSYENAPIILEFDKFTVDIANIASSLNDSQAVRLKARDYGIIDLLKAKNVQSEDMKMRYKARAHEQITVSFLPLIFIMFVLLCLLYPMPPRGFPIMRVMQAILLTIIFRVITSAMHNISAEYPIWITLSYCTHIVSFAAILSYILVKRRASL